MRTLASRVRVSPTRSYCRSCSSRSSLGCSVSGRSPISSRNSVPPAAAATLPSVSATAPVKAPRACPNSSLSSSSADRLGQFTVTKGAPARGLRAWTARASTPLLAGQAEVEHGDVARPAAGHLQGLRTVAGVGGVVPHRLQGRAHRPPQTGVVIDQQNFHRPYPVLREVTTAPCGHRAFCTAAL